MKRRGILLTSHTRRLMTLFMMLFMMLLMTRFLMLLMTLMKGHI